jgi:3-oxoacyl-[acyl-carrier protein] reductase
MSGLNGQVAIITGGALGIGLAYAQAFAAAGANVVVADLNGDEAERVASSLESTGVQALGLGVNVGVQADAERMAELTLARFGQIDALVNNAGIWQRPAVVRAPVEEMTLDEWNRVIAVNLTGTFLCCRAVIPAMKARGSGRIVNVSSTTIYAGTPHLAHYVSAKAGVIGLTRVLAKELGAFGINVNAIAPGLVLSDNEDDPMVRQRHEGVAARRSNPRVQVPTDLAGAALFLCSPESDFITGQTLVVDGGSYLL